MQGEEFNKFSLISPNHATLGGKKFKILVWFLITIRPWGERNLKFSLISHNHTTLGGKKFKILVWLTAKRFGSTIREDTISKSLIFRTIGPCRAKKFTIDNCTLIFSTKLYRFKNNGGLWPARVWFSEPCDPAGSHGSADRRILHF